MHKSKHKKNKSIEFVKGKEGEFQVQIGRQIFVNCVTNYEKDKFIVFKSTAFI